MGKKEQMGINRKYLIWELGFVLDNEESPHCRNAWASLDINEKKLSRNAVNCKIKNS